MNPHPHSLSSFLARWLPSLALAFGATVALAQADPPGRVAALSHMEGSVAFAPAGETEWAEAAINRPITRGDRLWTDPGARAEVHLGSAALHMGSQTFVEVVAVDDEVLQLSLNEGVVNARVRQLDGGENFEIATPQLAFRATQPGDYRIDVDPVNGVTRVAVRSGAAVVQGAGGGALQLQAGQQMAFAGRDLAAAAWQAPADDGIDQWAAARNHLEDKSISARYVPRDVVGYQQLDTHGTWSQDAHYGAVWYPRVVAADWAPYRYGRWESIAPWGWTWIDDAPWGFAPFHYGRWAHIGSRWAWVPGNLGPRPVYAPALVVFSSGSTGWNLSAGAGPGIAWFPLAPGEAWRPTYRTSNVYLRNVNRHVFTNHGGAGTYYHQRRPDAITAVRVEDFNRGRPVHQHWNRGHRIDLSRTQIYGQPVLPPPRRWAESEHAGRAGPARFPQGDGQWQWQQRAQEEQRRQHAQQIQNMQQMQQERARRDHQQRAQQMHEMQQVQRQREDQMRHQQAAQERFQRHQQWQQWPQQRAMPQHVQPLPAPRAVMPPQMQMPQKPQVRGEGRERGHDRGWRGHPQRDERAGHGGENGERGRGRGHRTIN